MIIGRKEEIKRMRDAYNSDYSAFMAVTGRRRVGKTFLIRETFNYDFAFQHSGLANQHTRQQLREFRQSLLSAGMSKCRIPSDWFDAFHLLRELLQSKEQGKKVVFIDELPWMDAPKSHFLSALESFWNGFASARKDILLIVCGSATSWIINNLYRNHGGLYNRVTCRINLKPFTLSECAEYVKARGLVMSKRQITEGYMIMGGIPYYWEQLEKGKSLDQNIDNLFFSDEGRLRYEYNELYRSLFKNPKPYIQIVEQLGTKKMGMTREELIATTGLPDNGKLRTCLDDLETCGFIRRYNTYGYAKTRHLFQLTDPYTLFYYKFIAEQYSADEHFWTNNIDTPLRNTWEGLAFEQVCFAHISQIKRALGIGGVSTQIFAWNVKSDPVYGRGTQIDLLIDRADDVINICEMKFSRKEFNISNDYMNDLYHKKERFRTTTNTEKALHFTMITTMGVVHNANWGEIQSEVTMNDLFKK